MEEIMVNIPQPNTILNTMHYVANKATRKFFKNGIELEKGAIITEKRIEKNRKLYEKYCNLWSVYPDLFLDTIKREENHFSLFFYQRLFLRLCMRQARLCVIAPRAFSKSFVSILAMYLMCIFRPGIKLFICANRQTAPCYRKVA